MVMVLWIWARRRLPAGRTRAAVDLLGLVALLQFALGIVTLLHAVPITFATAHQGGAFILLALAIWSLHSLGTIVQGVTKAS